MNKLRNRIAQGNTEGGFTLIELLVVIIILGILLAIAVPSYIGFKGKAEASAAAANLRAAVPAVEAFYADNGTYANMDAASTAAVPGIAYYDPASAAKVSVISANSTTYCISSTTGSSTWYKNGPASRILEVNGTKPATAGGALCSTT